MHGNLLYWQRRSPRDGSEGSEDCEVSIIAGFIIQARTIVLDGSVSGHKTLFYLSSSFKGSIFCVEKEAEFCFFLL